MTRQRRSFSASEKLLIINEADQLGVTQALHKHNLSHSVFRRWKENFNEGGVSNLQSYSRQRNPEVEALEEQIRVMKNIVAKQSIEMEFKTELLKKVNPSSSVGRGNGSVQIKTHCHKTGSIVLVRCSPQ
jgi:putative transposase